MALGGSGELDQLVTFERATATADTGGGTTRVWANLASNPRSWAAVKSLRVSEKIDNGRMNATYLVEFRIRWRSDLTEADRIVWQSERYAIKGIRRGGFRNQFTLIEAERGSPE